MIYTSYFAKSRKLTQHNIVQIGIALYPPSWFVGESIKELAPTQKLYNRFNRGISIGQYEKLFYNQLLKLDKDKILQKIKEIAGDQNSALLCFEKNDKFCHRHIVGEWLGINEWKESKMQEEMFE